MSRHKLILILWQSLEHTASSVTGILVILMVSRGPVGWRAISVSRSGASFAMTLEYSCRGFAIAWNIDRGASIIGGLRGCTRAIAKEHIDLGAPGTSFPDWCLKFDQI